MLVVSTFRCRLVSEDWKRNTEQARGQTVLAGKQNYLTSQNHVSILDRKVYAALNHAMNGKNLAFQIQNIGYFKY